MTVRHSGGVSVYGEFERPEVAALVPASATSLLDVGCASGAFGAGLIRSRPDLAVWGVESDPGDAARAAERYERVIEAQFPCPIERWFDCIAFNDVLEHMATPNDALVAATSMLSPGGVVVASIPNVRYFPVVADLALRGRWQYTDTGVLDRTHLRFFTRDSIRPLFEEAGFELERICGLSPLPVRRRFRPLAALVPTDMRFLQFGVVARPI